MNVGTEGRSFQRLYRRGNECQNLEQYDSCISKRRRQTFLHSIESVSWVLGWKALLVLHKVEYEVICSSNDDHLLIQPYYCTATKPQHSHSDHFPTCEGASRIICAMTLLLLLFQVVSKSFQAHLEHQGTCD